jgi:hypothetical protein
MPPVRILRAFLGAAACACTLAAAVPPAPAEIAQICAAAEDQAHCGRLVEEVQLKRLPNLARREGSVLTVSLYPSGAATFSDSDDPVNGRSYSLWDYVDAINAVVLYTNAGETSGYTLLLRTSNRRIDLPAEPRLSPDRQRLVTADICPSHCANEIAVWAVSNKGVSKDLVWAPDPGWTDASAKWKDADTLTIEYTSAGSPAGAVLERKLTDGSWKRLSQP